MPRVQRRWPRRIRRSSQSRGVSERNPRVSSGCSFWNAAVRPQAHILPRGRRAPRATWITYLEGGSWRSSEGREQPRFLTNATVEDGDPLSHSVRVRYDRFSAASQHGGAGEEKGPQQKSL